MRGSAEKYFYSSQPCRSLDPFTGYQSFLGDEVYINIENRRGSAGESDQNLPLVHSTLA